MQLLISLFGGLLVTLHIGDLPPFQVPLPFTVRRLAFGVLAFQIVLVLVVVLVLERGGHRGALPRFRLRKAYGATGSRGRGEQGDIIA